MIFPAFLFVGGLAPNVPKDLKSPSVTGKARATLDNRAEGNSQALACSPDGTGDRLACRYGVRECRSLPFSAVLESDRLDPTAEKCVLLFQPIKRGIQLRDNCLGLIGDHDQFDIDLLVLHLNSPSLQSYACRPLKHSKAPGPTENHSTL